MTEIFDEFLNQKYGKSLVIEGKPGSGKTTFTLDYLECEIKNRPVYYMAPRSSVNALKGKYPWIEGKSEYYGMNSGLSHVKKDSLMKFEKDVEEGKFDSFSTNGIVIDIEEVIPLIHSIYEFVDSNVGKDPLIAIDSIDALAEEYHIPEDLLFLMLKNDLVEGSGANIITILEAESNSRLEYFADGVVFFDYSIKDDILIRSLTIEKLRGVSIGSSPTYLFSLYDGDFHPIKKTDIIYPEKKIEFKHEDGSETDDFEVSLGNSELGKLIGKGKDSIPVGSIVVLHIREGSPVVNNTINLFKSNLIIENIMKNKGVIDVTASGYETYSSLLKILKPEYLANYFTTSTADNRSPYIISLKGKNMKSDFGLEAIQPKLQSSLRPYVYIISTDYLYMTYGKQFLNGLMDILDDIRTFGIVVMIANDEVFNSVFMTAHVIFDFYQINGYVIVSSKPGSGYVVDVDEDDTAWPKLKLIEIQ
ncbi:MAG: gas vesicle protein GvpD P-loop domain-containing protein [Thermoplasmata archaeon]